MLVGERVDTDAEPVRSVSPPRDQLHLLGLNDGERAVLSFFDRLLPIEWEIYVQPHLNGLRPDFVLLNPRVGIAVFEVKDWDLDACEYWVEQRAGRAPVIRGRRAGGRPFAKEHREDPFAQASLYRKEIAGLYCPSLDSQQGIPAVTAGVIFPSAPDRRVWEVFVDAYRAHQPEDAREYWRLIGKTTLERGAVEEALPSAGRRSSCLMTEAVAEELRHWLIDPEVARDQRTAPVLTASQRRHVEVREGARFRRLKGPAGSGKSVVLAARAEALDAEGKDVLVLTFNVTLPNYLRDLAAAFRRARGLNRPCRITWLNLHAWCKRELHSRGLGREYADTWRAYFERDETSPREVLDLRIPELVRQAPSRGEFDALLIDEGQDWMPEWFQAACTALRPGGEVFFVADAAQDLYDRAPRWTDGVMSGVGFRGDWRRLEDNHRLPAEAARYARDFAARHLHAEPDLLPTVDQLELDLDPCVLRWVQTDPEVIGEACLHEIDLLMERSRNSGAETTAWSRLGTAVTSPAP